LGRISRGVIDALARELPLEREFTEVKGVGPVPRDWLFSTLEEDADYS
jgi:hypothetical protein